MSSYSQVPLHVCKVNVDRPSSGWVRLLIVTLVWCSFFGVGRQWTQFVCVW